jgi:ketosteroid isomerase-like protein
MTKSELEAVVNELADAESIRDLARQYAHHVWRNDAASVVELFSEDGEMNTSLEQPVRGKAALRELFERLIGDSDFQPFVHNHVIDIRGDEASGTCYVDLRATVDGKSMIGSGYYEDTYVREGGVWKIETRGLTLRFFVPLEQGWADAGS